jgi:5,10-methenyltetrahydrofolate synthetase
VQNVATAMTWPEVKLWRKTARAKLIGARVALPAAARAAWTNDLVANLRPLLADAPPPMSFYWPFKGEPDLRSLMRALDAGGIVVALPVAVRLGEPMTFRPWRRGAPMERGIWDIPIPATPEEVVPRTVIAPILGYDDENYRLGYGGGFFDRTLVKLGPGAQAIGVGFSPFALPTIHPQPHDVAMARIVTEAVPLDLAAGASPACYLDEADPGYRGFLADGELAAALRPLAAALPPERLPLLEFVLWRLAGADEPVSTASIVPAPAPDDLSRLLPRIRDDAIHRAITVLCRSIESGGTT